MDFEQFPLKKKSLQKDNYDLEKKKSTYEYGGGVGVVASFCQPVLNLSLDSTFNFNNMYLLDNSEGKI